ncbi:Uncharacterized protein QJS10_CPB04g00087 [Acorus calamus]|uniref:Transferring glycosyl group transferase n=1 Tax=Acorus calamus TaxID=4465 RepID=A0AAV9F1Q2_ACOCL|nr:Uncharacterized protein QJS10_CPB04g00083 [Acorus calamus]KAK1319817.1 Uncharacterized protein QJS10_CPB04g00087 [Acorus calamus]
MSSKTTINITLTNLLLHLLCIFSITTSTQQDHPPIPKPWPLQFHSKLFMNYSGSLSLIDLWYDWPGGRNFNIIQDQLDQEPFYDLEWNNGTSFFYTLHGPQRSCRTAQLEVGILRPDWLDGATYLGEERVNGFHCNVWEKADFITYYEDVVTKRPVHWVFYTGRSAHVMTFEVGAVLEDAKWQAPVYCFEGKVEAAGRSGGIESVTADGEDLKNGEERRGLGGLMGF